VCVLLYKYAVLEERSLLRNLFFKSISYLFSIPILQCHHVVVFVVLTYY